MFGTLFSALGSSTSSGFSEDYNYTTKIKTVRIMLRTDKVSPDAIQSRWPSLVPSCVHLYVCLFYIRLPAYMVQDNVGCYSGPKELPKTSLCCDPINVPGQCIGSAINFTANPEFKPFVNQTTLSPICKNQPPIPTAPPSSPTDAPPASPTPSTPTPSSPKSGSNSVGRSVAGFFLSTFFVLLLCSL